MNMMNHYRLFLLLINFSLNLSETIFSSIEKTTRFLSHRVKTHVIEGRSYLTVPPGSCCEDTRWSFETSLTIIICILSTTWIVTGFKTEKYVIVRHIGLTYVLVSLIVPGTPLLTASLNTHDNYVDHAHDVLDLIVETIFVYNEKVIGGVIFCIAVTQAFTSILIVSGYTSCRNLFILITSILTIPVVELMLQGLQIPLLVSENNQRYTIVFERGVTFLALGSTLIILSVLFQNKIKRWHVLVAFIPIVSVEFNKTYSKPPTWSCRKLPEVYGQKDLSGLRRVSEYTTPFVIRNATNTRIDIDSLVSSCSTLKNTARLDVVPHLDAVRQPLRSLISIALWFRGTVMDGGFESVDSIVESYPPTLGEYNKILPKIRPLGSWSVFDRILFGVQPGFSYLTDTAFENDEGDVTEKCKLFGDAYLNITREWNNVKQHDLGTHIFMTRGGQQWSMAHVHQDVHYDVRKNWRWSWQVKGRKRWMFWSEEARDLIIKHGKLIAHNLNCCDTLGFTEIFGPTNVQSMALLESLPCYSVDMNEGDFLAFPLGMPHSLYSLDSVKGVMVSTATVLRKGLRPFTTT